ncbi:MAG TPA: serine/threonine-protein kinase [Pyrinomonadaceae bacterium]|nr:serine/threonine-protein kinase [Pyrinomonadaceae bacterium]
MPQTNSNQISTSRSLVAGVILQSRYRVMRQLGRGGMGAVYEAVDLRLGHSVAIKQTLTEDEQLWSQFEREARLMARLNHPALPRVSDYFTEGNRAFLVMQLVDGHDLAEVLAQQPGPLPERVVIAWADQLLDALIYLHSHDRQVVHRDIKPHNLKVAEGGRIVLLDFGLAKSQIENHDDKESGRSIFGYSPRYAPLEQIQDRGTTPQSDIYALGATLYHLLTGVKPPDALVRAAAVIASDPDPLRPAHAINSAIGIELSAILNRAMAQNPNQRYAGAAEFRDALRRVGRTDFSEEVEIVPHPGVIDATVVESGDTKVLARTLGASLSRLRSHALRVAFLLVLAAFGVFCRYYPWKMPSGTASAPTQNIAVARADSN